MVTKLRTVCGTEILFLFFGSKKVVVLGGGSFGTAMAAHVANRKAQLEVTMLVRDPQLCLSINERHCNW